MATSKKVKPSNTLNYSYIKAQIELEKGYKLLSTEYINAHTKMKICCSKNHIFDKDWNHWKNQNARCSVCKNTEIHDNQKYPTSKLLKDLKEDKLEIITWLDKYTNRDTRFILKCENEHVVQRTVGAYLNNKSRRNNICPQCSYEKHGDSISGANHYLWNGGTTEIRGYFQKQILNWKKESMKHCDYKCILTGSKNFEIHHLYGFDKILEEMFEISKLPKYQKIGNYTENELNQLNKNLLYLHDKYGFGVCLDSDIHKEFHKIYGYGNNTPEQFHDFRNTKVNHNLSE